jgi:hypothetical protein
MRGTKQTTAITTRTSITRAIKVTTIGTTRTSTIPRSIGVKKKWTYGFMPIIETPYKNNKVSVDAMD